MELELLFSKEVQLFEIFISRSLSEEFEIEFVSGAISYLNLQYETIGEALEDQDLCFMRHTSINKARLIIEFPFFLGKVSYFPGGSKLINNKQG